MKRATATAGTTATAPAAAPSAPAWTRTEVSVNGERGPHLVTAFVTAAAPGLAATEIRKASDDPNVSEPAYYSLTHVASGLSIGARLYELARAQELLLRLAPLGDWTRPADAMRGDEALVRKATRELRRRRKAEQ